MTCFYGTSGIQSVWNIALSRLLTILTVIHSSVQPFTPFCKTWCDHSSPIFQFQYDGFISHVCDSCFIADLLHVRMHAEFTTPVYVARSASCCWHWRASCSSTAWGWSEVCSSIYSGKDTVGTVRTMSGMVLVLRVLQQGKNVGVVVSGMQGMRGSSMAMRRGWKGVGMKPIEWSVFPSW